MLLAGVCPPKQMVIRGKGNESPNKYNGLQKKKNRILKACRVDRTLSYHTMDVTFLEEVICMQNVISGEHVSEWITAARENNASAS